MDVQNFDHSHHALKIRGLSSGVDVLSFEGKEQLSAPFRYDIQFTSSDKSIAPESVLMQDGAFSLTAPPVQGIPTQTPLRTLYGVITGFKQLSSSRDEARYEVRSGAPSGATVPQPSERDLSEPDGAANRGENTPRAP